MKIANLYLTAICSHAYIVGMAELLGTFEQIVLLTVRGLQDEAYGRAVLRSVQLAFEGKRNASAGAVYVTLDRLEAKGMLSSLLETGTLERGGRPRRFYRLTATGASSLTEARTVLEKLWQGQLWPLEVFS